MNMLIETLGSLSGSPATWITLVLLAILAGYSVYEWRTCPYACNTKPVDPEDARRAIEKPVFAGKRFLFVMLMGILTTLAGLSMMYRMIEPGIAFLMIVGGLVILQTEPIRLELRQALARVMASAEADEPTRLAATQSLQSSHLWLVSVHFVILFAILAVLVVF